MLASKLMLWCHFGINTGSLRWRHAGWSMTYQQRMRLSRLRMRRNIWSACCCSCFQLCFLWPWFKITQSSLLMCVAWWYYLVQAVGHWGRWGGGGEVGVLSLRCNCQLANQPLMETRRLIALRWWVFWCEPQCVTLLCLNVGLIHCCWLKMLVCLTGLRSDWIGMWSGWGEIVMAKLRTNCYWDLFRP